MGADRCGVEGEQLWLGRGSASVVDRDFDAHSPGRNSEEFNPGGFDAQLSSAPEGSPIWHKSPALRLMRQRPELVGTLLTKGTWDYAIIESLKPHPEDIVIDKPRANCFAGTNLDMLLRARGIRNIVVIGISSNVGVEWTMRDGLTREYFCVMLEDATMAAGPAFVHEATIFNVENFIGWVSTTDDFENAFDMAERYED